MTLNRIKLYISILIVTILSLNTIHAKAGVDGSPFEGSYLGFVTTKSTFAAVGTLGQFDDSDNPSIFNSIASTTSKNSYGGGFFAGYGLKFGSLYTSAEGAFIIDKGNTIFSDGTNTIKFAKSNTLDLNLRGGMEISDRALVFALIGYSGTNIKSDGINGRQNKDAGGINYNKRLTSFRYGAGIEVAIYENIAIRAEYTRSIIGSDIYIDGSDLFSIKPKTSRIMFSVVLHMY
ncbi:MAG: outer membrane beta-barrel protein [Emcibacteraceae bacterium]|nr:outer membrane beta-barrel protein [Emcibacteraceae bacterium]